MDRYFQSLPPFSSSKESKKNEFPDAFALLSVEKWAINHDTKVIAVSDDNDWAAYCINSPHLILVNKQAKALSYFQTHVSVAINALLNALRSNELPDVVSAIEQKIEDRVDKLDITVEADTAYFYDYDIANKEVIWSSFEDLNSIELLPVNTTDDRIDIEIRCEVRVRIEIDFSFSVIDSIDKDSIPLGSTRYSDTFQTPLSVLIAFDREQIEAGIIEDLLVEGLRRVYLHVGEIEPDWLDN